MGRKAYPPREVARPTKVSRKAHQVSREAHQEARPARHAPEALVDCETSKRLMGGLVIQHDQATTKPDDERKVETWPS